MTNLTPEQRFKNRCSTAGPCRNCSRQLHDRGYRRQYRAANFSAHGESWLLTTLWGETCCTHQTATSQPTVLTSATSLVIVDTFLEQQVTVIA